MWAPRRWSFLAKKAPAGVVDAALLRYSPAMASAVSVGGSHASNRTWKPGHHEGHGWNWLSGLPAGSSWFLGSSAVAFAEPEVASGFVREALATGVAGPTPLGISKDLERRPGRLIKCFSRGRLFRMGEITDLPRCGDARQIQAGLRALRPHKHHSE